MYISDPIRRIYFQLRLAAHLIRLLWDSVRELGDDASRFRAREAAKRHPAHDDMMRVLEEPGWDRDD